MKFLCVLVVQSLWHMGVMIIGIHVDVMVRFLISVGVGFVKNKFVAGINNIHNRNFKSSGEIFACE